MDEDVQGIGDTTQQHASGSASAPAAADAGHDQIIKLQKYIAANGGVLADGWSVKRTGMAATHSVHVKYLPPEGFIPAAGQPFRAQYNAMTRVAEAMGLATGGPQRKRGPGLCQPEPGNAPKVSSTKKQRTSAATQQLSRENAPAPAAQGSLPKQRRRPQQGTKAVQRQNSQAEQAGGSDPAETAAGATGTMPQTLLEVLQLNVSKDREVAAALQRVAAAEAERKAFAKESGRQIRQLQQRVAELESGRDAELERCKRQLVDARKDAASSKAEAKELSAKLAKAESGSHGDAALTSACKTHVDRSSAGWERLAPDTADAEACRASNAEPTATDQELKGSDDETQRLCAKLEVAQGLASGFASAIQREVAAQKGQRHAQQKSARLEQELADRKVEYEAELTRMGKEKVEALQQEIDDMLKMVGRADRAADEHIKAHAAKVRQQLKAQERKTAAAKAEASERLELQDERLREHARESRVYREALEEKSGQLEGACMRIRGLELELSLQMDETAKVRKELADMKAAAKAAAAKRLPTAIVLPNPSIVRAAKHAAVLTKPAVGACGQTAVAAHTSVKWQAVESVKRSAVARLRADGLICTDWALAGTCSRGEQCFFKETHFCHEWATMGSCSRGEGCPCTSMHTPDMQFCLYDPAPMEAQVFSKPLPTNSEA